MKQTVFKCVTALLCVIAVCVTSTMSIGKYSEAVKEKAKIYAEAGIGTGASNGTDTSTGSDVSSDVPSSADSPVADPAATDTPAASTDTPAASTDTPSTGSNSSAASSASASSNDPTKFSKAQIIEYYNSCLKKAYAAKVVMNKSETIDIHVESISAGGDAVLNLVNNTILPKFIGTTPSDRELTGTKEDLEERGPNFASPYKLVPDGAASAKIEKNGSNYDITINVVKETATLSTPPKYNSMCAHPLDLATVDISPAKVTKADFTYSGTVLKCTVDANGKVLKTSIHQPLTGTGEGKCLVTLSATLSGTFDQSVTYSYK